MLKKLMGFTFIFVLLDQASKLVISFFMNVNQSITLIPNFFNLTHVHNTGAAFSILQGNRWLFVIISFIVLNIIYAMFIKNKNLNKWEIIIYAILLSGIMGNMIDRIVYGYVIDFLDFIIFGYDFAIFNLADSFIVISVIFLLILSFKEERKCKKTSLKLKTSE